MLKDVQNRATGGPVGGLGDMWTAFEALTVRVLEDSRANAAALAERDKRLQDLEEVIAHQSITIDTLNEQLGRADAAVARVDELEAKLTATEARFVELQVSAAAAAIEAGRLITEVDERIDTDLEQLRADVGKLTVHRVSADLAIAGAGERLEAIETAIAEVANAASTAALEQTKAIAGVLVRVEDHQTARMAVEQDLGERIAGVSARLEDVAAVVPLVTETANGFRELVARVDQHGQLHVAIEGRVTGTDDAIDEITAAIGRLETSTAADVAGMREEIATTADETLHEITRIRNETGRITSALPRRLMIDHAGDLIAVTGEGEIVNVGPVRGQNGEDGATVSDVQLVDDRLRITMTDGRRFDAGKIPVAPPAVMTEAQMQARACALHDAGNPYTKIAAELGVDRRKVSKWVRGKKRDDQGG